MEISPFWHYVILQLDAINKLLIMLMVVALFYSLVVVFPAHSPLVSNNAKEKWGDRFKKAIVASIILAVLIALLPSTETAKFIFAQ